MGGERAQRIEAAVDGLAATAFAGAAAFASFKLVIFREAPQWGLALAGGLLGLVVCFGILRLVRAEASGLAMAKFEIADLPPPEIGELLLTEMPELVLTDALRVEQSREAARDELVLDDILAQMGPDSRVVRLFDAAAMPTPGQLRSRIDRHLQGGTPRSPSHDDSQALYDALAQLRRSLR